MAEDADSAVAPELVEPATRRGGVERIGDQPPLRFIHIVDHEQSARAEQQPYLLEFTSQVSDSACGRDWPPASGS